MQLIPIKNIISNWDSILKAREAFLIQKGRPIDPDGLNICEETYRFLSFVFFVCLFVFYCVLLSSYFILPHAYLQFTLSITFAYFRYYVNISYIKTRTNVKSSIVPEEAWFGQPKYSTPSKKSFYVVSVFAFVFFISIFVHSHFETRHGGSIGSTITCFLRVDFLRADSHVTRIKSKADCDQTSMFQRTTHFFAAYDCIKKVCFEKQCRLLF